MSKWQKSPSRRQFLSGSAAAVAGSMSAGAAAAQTPDPLITQVQDWASYAGDGVDEVRDRRAEGQLGVAEDRLAVLARQRRDLPQEGVDRLEGGPRVEPHRERLLDVQVRVLLGAPQAEPRAAARPDVRVGARAEVLGRHAVVVGVRGVPLGCVLHHALRNALNPVVTAASGWFASMLAGAVFVEYVFGWQGLGMLMFRALEQSDLPVVMGCVASVALTFVIVNVLVDQLYRVLDPRVRVG